MSPGKTILIAVLFVYWEMLCGVTGQCTESKYSIKHSMLRQHVFKKLKTSNPYECLVACEDDVRCQSFNYVFTQNICELNDRTKEARPEDFVANFSRYYYGRVKNRVPLGSIPELPAKTCKEIKASEGEQAVSGKYWFDSIQPGKTIFAECDMNTEDINECSAADQLCDLNADCINTHGSYYCSCLTGFTGDGEHCKDIDECTSGSHNCLSDTATCTNTYGSYNCACIPGCEGDGKTSCIVSSPECQTYNSLTRKGRKYTYKTKTNAHCDSTLSGWYRIHGDAGTKMPTSCVPIDRCNTNAPGWLNGTHPSVADGQVTRQVCFNWISNCCYWSINIQVRNCGDFYVYYLSGTPAGNHCHLRYCSSD